MFIHKVKDGAVARALSVKRIEEIISKAIFLATGKDAWPKSEAYGCGAEDILIDVSVTEDTDVEESLIDITIMNQFGDVMFHAQLDSRAYCEADTYISGHWEETLDRLAEKSADAAKS